MQFNKYEDINIFWNDTKELLEKEEWYNCLMIGNCMEGTQKGKVDWFLVTITNNNGNIELIMLYRKPWKLILYSPSNNYSDEILEFAANEIYKYDKELLGVNSEKRVANKFAKYYCNLSNIKYIVHTGLRILLLENIEKGYYVLVKDNKIICQANTSRVMKYGKCVSGVYTPKEERGKSYAYNLIYRISKELLDKGDKYCVLYTDDANPISNHVYEKIGYKRKSDWEELDFIK